MDVRIPLEVCQRLTRITESFLSREGRTLHRELVAAMERAKADATHLHERNDDGEGR